MSSVAVSMSLKEAGKMGYATAINAVLGASGDDMGAITLLIDGATTEEKALALVAALEMGREDVAIGVLQACPETAAAEVCEFLRLLGSVF